MSQRSRSLVSILLAPLALIMALTAATPFQGGEGPTEELLRELKEVAQNEYPKTGPGKEAQAELAEMAAECGFDAAHPKPDAMSPECAEEYNSWKKEMSAEITALHGATRGAGSGPGFWEVAGVIVGVIGIAVTLLIPK